MKEVEEKRCVTVVINFILVTEVYPGPQSFYRTHDCDSCGY